MKFLKVFLIACLAIGFSFQQVHSQKSTYFEYSPSDLAKLKSLETNLSFSADDLQKWDKIAIASSGETPGSSALLRIITYLYAAQADAAFLSYQAKGKFAGTLDPVSVKILTILLPSFQAPAGLKTDPYSEALATIVTEKIRKRIATEDTENTTFKVPKEKADIYVIGLNTAGWQPWFAKPIAAYFPPPPPDSKDPYWKKQIAQIKEMQTPMTDDKKKVIDFWAGISNPDSGEWRIIANQYLFTHPIPLETILQARSLLMKGLYDGTIIGFAAKYKYLTPRPQEYDPASHYEIPVPKHPSYPANHALQSNIASLILSALIPSETQKWQQLAEEAGTSRIWAGIHYPLDIDAGNAVGKKIGDAVLKGAGDNNK